VLERAEHARRRSRAPLGVLERFEVGYRAFNPLETMPDHVERLDENAPAEARALLSDLELGASAPLAALARAWEAGAERVGHELRSRDGITAKSEWVKNPEVAS
jgi:hypothetical protein